MKTKSNIILIAIAASLSVFSARAQGTFTFVTSLGSGSFSLNPNNLVNTGSPYYGSAGFNDILDSLTINGITYTNLHFTVYDNTIMLVLKDGFQILVDKNPSSNAARLEIDVMGDPSVINGLSTADLVTVLSNVNALQASSFYASSFYAYVIYNNPNPPFQQLSGSLTSFQAVPEPASLTLLGLGLPVFLAFRHRSKHYDANKSVSR